MGNEYKPLFCNTKVIERNAILSVTMDTKAKKIKGKPAPVTRFWLCGTVQLALFRNGKAKVVALNAAVESPADPNLRVLHGVKADQLSRAVAEMRRLHLKASGNAYRRLRDAVIGKLAAAVDLACASGRFGGQQFDELVVVKAVKAGDK